MRSVCNVSFIVTFKRTSGPHTSKILLKFILFVNRALIRLMFRRGRVQCNGFVAAAYPTTIIYMLYFINRMNEI